MDRNRGGPVACSYRRLTLLPPRTIPCERSQCRSISLALIHLGCVAIWFRRSPRGELMEVPGKAMAQEKFADDLECGESEATEAQGREQKPKWELA